MGDCIFCKIAAGEIPVDFLYEDDDVVAFRDMSPQAPVHVLVIPRTHCTNLSDPRAVEVAGAVFSAVGPVARLAGIEQSGYRIVANAGPDAGQTVDHLHVHVMGGQHLGHRIVAPYDEA